MFSTVENYKEKYIAFFLENEMFAIPIKIIREIIETSPITIVPNVAPDILGVINLRGQVVPVMDAKKKLGLGKSKNISEAKIVILHTDNRIIGLLVDRIKQIFEISDKDIESPSKTMQEKHKRTFIAGISRADNNYIMLLNIVAMLQTSKTKYAEEKFTKNNNR